MVNSPKPPSTMSNYAAAVIERGPETIGKELDRLQNAIQQAKNHISQESKASVFLYLSPEHWHYPSYGQYQRDCQKFVEAAKAS